MPYFDYAATTPLCVGARQEMELWMGEKFHNASSLYRGGREAGAAVDLARSRVAALLGADPEEVVFTSGGTEADNTAIISGALLGRQNGRNKIIVSAIEHHAVLESAEFLKAFGFEIVILPVDAHGYVSLKALESELDANTALLSVMWVNNELGTIQDVTALAQAAHCAGALFHTDAVQALSTQSVDFHACGADLMSVSSHKIYGPKGCGAIVVRSGLSLPSFMHGGQQENGHRGGTENVAAIAGFGKAAELMLLHRTEYVEQMRSHRSLVLDRMLKAGARINSPEEAAPSILNIAFKDVEAEGMMFYLNMQDFCVSMGSACNSRSVEPSHVIRAIGVPEEYARGCIRISFGCGQTDEDCLQLSQTLIQLESELKT